MAQSFPYPGMSAWTNANGAVVLRLHYSADPTKGLGEKTSVKIAGKDRELSPWALAEFNKMTDKGLYVQEYEIDGDATLGQLVYNMDPEATLEKPIPIPEKWTRYFSLDPHPAVPHAMLWCAVDTWGDRWYYREYWPSKVYGLPGLCPEDDNRAPIRDYVEVMKYLESEDNPQNVDKNGKRFNETIYKRVIDYAARAFGKGTSDDPEQPNFQQRFEKHMLELDVSCPRFDDAKKDHSAGVEAVNAGLKPRLVEGPDGAMIKRSAIHIIADNCPELVYQLTHIRNQQLTPLQAARMDPTGKPVAIRTHMGDNIRYIEMANPTYIDYTTARSHWEPQYEGLSY